MRTNRPLGICASLAAHLVDVPQQVGRIVDLVIKKDGAVPAAIVSVGGFLGIATKYVAVPFTAFQATPAERRPHLVLDTNRKALRSAPAFEFNRLTGRWERVEDN